MFLTDFGMITMVSVTSCLTGHRILSQGSSTTTDINIADKKHLRTSEKHSSKFWNTQKSLRYTDSSAFDNAEIDHSDTLLLFGLDCFFKLEWNCLSSFHLLSLKNELSHTQIILFMSPEMLREKEHFWMIEITLSFGQLHRLFLPLLPHYEEVVAVRTAIINNT